jgi:hypothetical protein
MNFVRSSWLNVFTLCSHLERTHTAAGMRRLLDRVLANPRTAVHVAADAEDDGDLLGYVVLTGNVLSMALTKRDSRRQGVCRALLAEAPTGLRVWWPSAGLQHIAKCADVALDPLALLEL